MFILLVTKWKGLGSNNSWLNSPTQIPVYREQPFDPHPLICSFDLCSHCLVFLEYTTTFSLSYVFGWLCALCSWTKFSLSCFLFKYSGTLSLHACVTCAAVPSSLCPVLVCSYQTSQPPSGTTRGASGVAPGIWVLADWGSSAPWGIYGTQHCSAWSDNVGTTPAAGWHCVAVLLSDDL